MSFTRFLKNYQPSNSHIPMKSIRDAAITCYAAVTPSTANDVMTWAVSCSEVTAEAA